LYLCYIGDSIDSGIHLLGESYSIGIFHTNLAIVFQLATNHFQARRRPSRHESEWTALIVMNLVTL